MYFSWPKKNARILVALLVIDLDDFKVVNDNWGHEAGDSVLRYAANTLQATVRETDTAARFGGDEFVVLLSNIRDVCYESAPPKIPIAFLGMS